VRFVAKRFAALRFSAACLIEPRGHLFNEGGNSFNAVFTAEYVGFMPNRWGFAVMAISRSYRSRTELRKKPRRQFHYAAKIVTDAQKPARPCTIADISHNGACLVLTNDEELPARFFLLLTSKGETRRCCRVIWRTGTTAGVEFTDWQS
jgi:hypothetical protein